MARQRMLHPNFFTDADLLSLSPLHRLLFQGLWCHADRDGRLLDKPRDLRLRILPADQCDIDAMLTDLAAVGMVLRYESDGIRCLLVTGFSRHQRPHPKEPKSLLPAPPAQPPENRAAVEKHGEPCKNAASNVRTAKTVQAGQPDPFDPAESESESESVKAFAGAESAPADAAPVEPPKQEPKSPRLKPLTESLVAMFLELRGQPYKHQGAKDAKALKALLPVATDEEIRSRWRQGLESARDWTRISTLAQLGAKWNDLGDAGAATRPKDPARGFWDESDFSHVKASGE